MSMSLKGEETRGARVSQAGGIVLMKEPKKGSVHQELWMINSK